MEKKRSGGRKRELPITGILAGIVLILLIGILVVLKSHQLTKPYKYLWVILVLLFNLLGIIAFLIWKQYLNKMSNSGSHGNV